MARKRNTGRRSSSRRETERERPASSETLAEREELDEEHVIGTNTLI
jgi:hypothetical protein